MARKFINEKGFTVYEMTGVETMEFGGYGICDYCNGAALKGVELGGNLMKRRVYVITVMGQL